MKQDYYDAFSEVHVILNQMEKQNLEKIPIKFQKFIEENRNVNYEVNRNERLLDNVSLLKKETKIILGIIYKDYFATEEKEKYRQNIAEFNEIYSYENLFKKKSNKIEENEKLIDISNENIVMKIIRKVRISIYNLLELIKERKREKSER